MSSEQVWALAGGVLVLTLLALVVLARHAATRSRRALAAARAEARSLAERLAAVEETLARNAAPTPADVTQSYVITHLGDDQAEGAAAPVVGRIDGRLFADIVARESAIKAVGLAHGLRRALAPEVRNRIRFEIKREVLRARKQRRADLKVALREFRARERADLAGAGAEDERHDEGDAA